MRYLAILIVAAGLSGCTGGGTDISAGGTFIMRVGTEQFRVRIDNALLASKARRMMTGLEQHQIVVGQLDRGDGGFNTGYKWHMKPSTISFADVTIELCDGRPSDIESDVDYWVDTVKQYCPWGGRFISEVGRF